MTETIRFPAAIDHGAVFEARAERVLGNKWRTRFSRGSGVHYATVKRWREGDLPVPQYAWSILDLLESVPKAFWPDRWAQVMGRHPPGSRPGGIGQLVGSGGAIVGAA